MSIFKRGCPSILSGVLNAVTRLVYPRANAVSSSPHPRPPLVDATGNERLSIDFVDNEGRGGGVVWYGCGVTVSQRWEGFTMYGVQLSKDLDDFLAKRERMGLADAEIARKFLNAQVDPDDDDAHDYFGMRFTDNGPRITYLTNARAKQCDGDEFDRYSLRYAGKPAKVAKRITGVDNGNALAVFTSALVAEMIPPPPVELVRGADIDRYFPRGNFCSCEGRRLGSLGSSCMAPDAYVRENRFQLWKDVAELAVVVCPVCQGTLGRCVVLTDDRTGQKRHSYVYAGDEVREAINDFFLREGIELGDSGEAWFRVEAHAEGYGRLPSTDRFLYCSRCNTLGTTYCSAPDSWYVPERSRECVPSTKLFPR